MDETERERERRLTDLMNSKPEALEAVDRPSIYVCIHVYGYERRNSGESEYSLEEEPQGKSRYCMS